MRCIKIVFSPALLRNSHLNNALPFDFSISGIIWANGQQWKEMRKFAVVTMRDMGVGKKTLELRVQEEGEFLAQEFLKHEKRPFRPDAFLRKTVSNIICGVTFGQR